MLVFFFCLFLFDSGRRGVAFLLGGAHPQRQVLFFFFLLKIPCSVRRQLRKIFIFELERKGYKCEEHGTFYIKPLEQRKQRQKSLKVPDMTNSPKNVAVTSPHVTVATSLSARAGAPCVAVYVFFL